MSCVLLGSSATFSTTTDAAGAYTINGLDAGKYKVFFSTQSGSADVPDYVSQYYGGGQHFDAETPIDVPGTGAVADINASLSRGGSISGRVTNASAIGLSGVGVNAFDATPQGGFGFAITDATGNFTLRGLKPGSYRVHWNPQRPGPSQDYGNQSRAGTVNVTAGATTSGIDAVLNLGGAITGRVTRSDNGVGIDRAEVYASGATPPYYFGFTETDAGGFYTLRGLPQGEYRVTFDPGDSSAGDHVAEVYNNRPPNEFGDSVNVTTGVTTGGINASLDRGHQISGRVTTTNGDAVPFADARVEDANGFAVAFAFADVNGNYTTSPGLTNGTYRVRFGGRSDNCFGLDVATVFYGGTPTSQGSIPIVVSGPGVTPGVNQVMPPSIGTITGRVTLNGSPFASTFLNLSNDNFANTDASGYYTFTSLMAATYVVSLFYTFPPFTRTISLPPSVTNVNFDISTRYLPIAVKPPLRSDDFSHPTSDWFVGEAPFARWSYQAGEYEIDVLQPNIGVTSVPSNEQLTDFTLEIDGRHIAGNQGYYGVIFSQSANGFYLFTTDPNERDFFLDKYTPASGYQTLASAVAPGAIKGGSEKNRLRVEHSGGRISVYANGQLLATVNDSSLPPGTVGLWASALNTLPATMRFDNYALTVP